MHASCRQGAASLLYTSGCRVRPKLSAMLRICPASDVVRKSEWPAPPPRFEACGSHDWCRPVVAKKYLVSSCSSRTLLISTFSEARVDDVTCSMQFELKNLCMLSRPHPLTLPADFRGLSMTSIARASSVYCRNALTIPDIYPNMSAASTWQDPLASIGGSV